MSHKDNSQRSGKTGMREANINPSPLERARVSVGFKIFLQYVKRLSSPEHHQTQAQFGHQLPQYPPPFGGEESAALNNSPAARMDFSPATGAQQTMLLFK